MEETKETTFKNRRERAKEPRAIRGLTKVQNNLGKNRKRMMALIALPVLGLVLLGSGYVLFVQSKSKSLQAAVTDSKKEVSATIQSFSKKYQGSDPSKKVKLISALQFKQLDCGGFSLLSPALAEALKRCNRHNKSLASLHSELNRAATIVKYDVAAQKSFSKTKTDSDDWKRQQAAWQSRAESLQKLNPPKELKNAHKELVKRLSEVATGWKKLQEADEAKKLDNYKAAKKDLATKYENLRKVSETYHKLFDDTQNRLANAAKAVTN